VSTNKNFEICDTFFAYRFTEFVDDADDVVPLVDAPLADDEDLSTTLGTFLRNIDSSMIALRRMVRLVSESEKRYFCN